MSDDAFDADVLVVGFGPTGASLTGLLGAAGLSVLAVDRLADVHPDPRAVHFDAEIMRVFQGLGIAEALAPHITPSPDYEFRTARGEVLMRLPARAQTPFAWAGGYMFHQPGLERTLRARAMREPGVDVRLGVALDRFSQDASGVSAMLKGPADEQVVRCRYLVGCDGGSSPVREAAGLPLEDLRFDEPWLVVDVTLGPRSRTPELNLQICDPARPTTCVLTGPGRHRWEFMLRPDETPEQVLAPGFVEALLEPWEAGPDTVVERRAVYRFHGLVAERWREGRVLIAGDAAHQMPPMAGQGMCSGVRDAANLAWKLAAVVSGEADDTLLDTYAQERRPHARQVVEIAIGLGRVVCATDPVVAAGRDAAMLADRAAGKPPSPIAFAPFREGAILAGSAGAGTLFPQPVADAGDRLDDVLGGGAWLLTRGAAPTGTDPLTVVSTTDARLAPFNPGLTAWLDAHGAEAVLVRPDRVVFGVGAPKALRDAWRAVLNPPTRAARP